LQSPIAANEINLPEEIDKKFVLFGTKIAQS
jgi:hypothetical protein